MILQRKKFFFAEEGHCVLTTEKRLTEELNWNNIFTVLLSTSCYTLHTVLFISFILNFANQYYKIVACLASKQKVKFLFTSSNTILNFDSVIYLYKYEQFALRK